MFETVRDNVPLLEYRKVTGERFGQVAPDMLVNYVAEVPDFLTPHARRPEIAEFDGELYIMGDAQDLPFHCAYIKQHPSTEYNIAVFTSEEAARERAVSLFGADPEDMLALAQTYAPDVVAEELLEEFGDDMNEAGRFSRQSNQQALASRRNDPLAKLRTVSNISNVIKSSITGFDAKTVNKAPLLIGHSGISKSATIKAVIKELNSGISEASGNWGYRLVDIRAAFFDKMDLLGMITLTSETDGSDGSLASQMNERWTDSPKLELLTCTTAFVESCRAMVTKIDNGEVEADESDAEFVSRLREYAKTPVMFFDEINRTPKEVMNQLMVMINGHALNDYDISIAPKLAAANLPVEIEKLDDLDPEAYEKLIYLVQNVDDAAKVDRFIPYIVSSDDPTIQRGAYDFLIEQPFVAKHDVLKELSQYGFDNQILHDISAMDTDGKFPTFRGWEDTMKYLSWCIDNDETPYLAVIKGILGEKTATEIARQLEASNIEVDLDTSDTSSFVDHTYRAGLPMMLLGRMGIAKTAKINKAIKENGDESIRIDLSSTDRVNVGGFPRPAPFLREAFGFGYKEKGVESKEEAMALKLAAVESTLFQQFEQEVKAAGEVPHQTTSYVPNKQLQDKLDAIRAAQGDGKRLVLVFDEINRCSPVVQSAVFEAISDARLFGCDLRGIDYSVVAAGNYDDSEGFDPESGSMGSTFDAAPIDTATMHRFATQIVRELSEEDVVQFMEFLKENLPAAHYVAEKIGSEDLMELLNTPYDEMGDGADGEEAGGLANPVFTMRTLQALHNMLTVQHPYVMASIAMEEAGASVPYESSPAAQAEAFVNIYDNPNLILFAEDKGMGFPAKELANSGLSTALGLPKAGTVLATDIFAAIRDVCISLANGEPAVIDRLTEQFGTLTDFMFRVHSVVNDIELSLDNSSTQLTYQGIIPSYAMDVVGEAVEKFYTAASVKAAKGTVFDVLALFDEGADDDVLSQLISRYMGTVASETQLDFGTLFLSMLEETLDENPQLTPSADHLKRLRDLFNLHPLAAARQLSTERFSRFLMRYQNKVTGAASMVEALTKVSIELNDWPKIVDAGAKLLSGAMLQSGMLSSNYFAITVERAKAKLAQGEDVYRLGLAAGAEVNLQVASKRFSSKEEAYDYLNKRDIGAAQLVALMELWQQCANASEGSDYSLVASARGDGKLFGIDLPSGSVTLGSVQGHDGYTYPDYNKLIAFASMSPMRYEPGSGVKTGKAYSLSMREAFTLARMDAGSAFTKMAAGSSDWYVDLTYKANADGIAVEVKATDVLAVADKALTLPRATGAYNDEARDALTPVLLLATAKAVTGGHPATHPAFMGDEGVAQLPYLNNLNSDDHAFSAAFLQLNFDVELTQKGARNASDKITAMEALRRPDASTSLDQTGLGITDAEQMFVVLRDSRVPARLDVDATGNAIRQQVDTLSQYLPATMQSLTPSLATTAAIEKRESNFASLNYAGALSRLSRSLRGVWN